MSWLKDSRPDHAWSWVMAVCCSLVTFGSFGIFRASGVYYVAVRESLALNRETASWPFSCCGAINCFSGLISGFLFHFFSLRQVILSGVSLSFLGLFLCYFATDITWIAVSYGVVFGFGIGFVIVAMPLVINQNFVKYKTSANGVFLAGGTLASFFIPSMAEYFVETYDLKGAFLLTSAIPIQALVFAALLRGRNTQPRPSSEETKPSLENLDLEKKVPIDQEAVTEDVLPAQKEYLVPLRQATDESSRANGKYVTDVYQSTTEKTKPEKSVGRNILEVFALCKNVLQNPMFGIITFSNVSCHFLILTFTMIVVDLGLDKGMDKTEAVALASVLAIPELIGRLCFGWVSDKGYISRKHLLVTAEIFAGCLLCIMTLTDNKYFIFTLCGLFGLALGNAFILINVFYMQLMKPEELPISIALKHGFTGFAFLLRPTITGLFRDDIGSYSYLLWTLGALSITAGATWKIEEYIKYNRTIKDVIKARKQNSELFKA